MLKLSIIIPCHNEAKNLPFLIKDLSLVCQKNNYKSQVIVVNDCSTDHSSFILKDLQKQYSFLKVINREHNPGPGNAIRAGLKKVKYPVTITMDGDLSHQPKELPSLIKHFSQNKSDLVIGSRFIPGGSSSLPPLRQLVSRTAAKITSSLSQTPVHDITSGFRVHNTKMLKNLNLQTKNFDIHLEIPLKAHISGFKIGEAPIHYVKRRFGYSKMRLFRLAPLYLKVLFELVYFQTPHTHPKR